MRLTDLAESEQRLFELARQEMPLAELAVRLGVPVGDAATRLHALCERLGVEGRDGLRALTFDDGPSAAAPIVTADEPHRYSRRRILSAGIAGGLAVAAGGAALGYWATRGGSGSPAAASPTATTTPGSTASATQTAFDLIKPAASDTWESRTFAPGQEIDWDAGIFFMDVGSGAVEAWRLTQAGTPDGQPAVTPFIRSFFGGDLIVAQGGDNTLALNRKTGARWQWPSHELFLSDYVAGCYVFRDTLYGNGSGPQSPVYFAQADLHLQSAFTVDTRGISPQFVASPDRRRVAYVDGGVEDAPFQLHLRDIATGKQVAEQTVGTAGDGLGMMRVVSIPSSNVIVISRSEPSVDSRGNPVAHPRSVRITAPWSGEWNKLQQTDGPPLDGLSPDGKSEASMTVMLSQMGVGGFYWPALVMRGPDGAERFAALSVATPLGSSVEGSWLADSSALMVMHSGGKEGGGFYDNYSYSLLDPHSGAFTPLKLPALPGNASPYAALYEFPPSPSPTDPQIVALGPTAALNRATDRFVHANLGQYQPPLFSNPWSGRPNEIAWSLPVPGKDGPQVPFLIPPKLIHGDLPTAPFHFTVAQTGDCLNMRDTPSLKGNVMACLADGTPLTLAEWPNPQAAPYVSYTANADGMWVYVSTSGGLTGWVAAAYLDWAV